MTGISVACSKLHDDLSLAERTRAYLYALDWSDKWLEYHYDENWHWSSDQRGTEIAGAETSR